MRPTEIISAKPAFPFSLKTSARRRTDMMGLVMADTLAPDLDSCSILSNSLTHENRCHGKDASQEVTPLGTIQGTGDQVDAYDLLKGHCTLDPFRVVRIVPPFRHLRVSELLRHPCEMEAPMLMGLARRAEESGIETPSATGSTFPPFERFTSDGSFTLLDASSGPKSFDSCTESDTKIIPARTASEEACSSRLPQQTKPTNDHQPPCNS